MANQRLQHDAAYAIAKACLEVIASCVHPACHKDAWEEFYRIAKSGIEGYEIHTNRMLHRLRPSRN